MRPGFCQLIGFEKFRTKRSLINRPFLACMFCFPIADHVIVPERTVSFKRRPMHVHPRAFVCIIIIIIIFEKTKRKISRRTSSCGLNRGDKIYKLKSSNESFIKADVPGTIKALCYKRNNSTLTDVTF